MLFCFLISGIDSHNRLIDVISLDRMFAVFAVAKRMEITASTEWVIIFNPTLW